MYLCNIHQEALRTLLALHYSVQAYRSEPFARGQNHDNDHITQYKAASIWLTINLKCSKFLLSSEEIMGSIDNTGRNLNLQFQFRVRTAPPVSVRVRNRVSVSFSFVSFSFTIYHAPRVVHVYVNPYRHSVFSMCPEIILLRSNSITTYHSSLCSLHTRSTTVSCSYRQIQDQAYRINRPYRPRPTFLHVSCLQYSCRKSRGQNQPRRTRNLSFWSEIQSTEICG